MINKDNIIIPIDFISNIGIEGKNSEVFLARDININREIVIKKIDKSTLNGNFFEEAKYLYQNKHPNVVEISYAGESQCKNFVYLAMPYYKNGSLNSKIINFRKNLTIKETIKYAFYFLSGLQSIHQKKFIHLDIKPDNILITDNNEAILSDFGLVDKTNFFGSSSSKKPLFSLLIPPENIEYKNNIFKSKLSYSKVTDIYQVGVTLYCLVNLIVLDKHLEEKQIYTRGDLVLSIKNGSLYDIKKYEKNVPIELQKIINKCLAINPNNRYQSVQKILNDLGSLNE
jgi:serine/threonine protein kinase